MSSPFAIVPEPSSVKLNAQGKGEVRFTVTNKSGRPIRARARVEAQDAAQKSWFRLDGEAERNFPSDNSTDQFLVQISAPPDNPPGKAAMHLDMFSVQDPQDVFTVGPMVSCELVRAEAVRKGRPWWVYAAAAAVLILVIATVMLLSRGGKVPNVVDLSFTEAQKKLSAAGMKMGQTNSKTTGKAPGTVLAQTPAAGAEIPSHKTINLDVEQEAARDVLVPAISGLALTDAQDQLTKARLKPGKFTYDMAAAGKPNTVLQQNPRAGIRVPLDTEIDMVVKADSVSVPALVGYSLQNALLQLQNMDLQMKLSEQVIDPRVRAPGTVMSQTPPPQTVVSRKSEVSMVVARAPGLTVGVLDPAIAQRLNVQTMKSLQGLSAARDLAPQK
ncbi:MAG: hypothetical protein JWN34_4391 [Bryobacterales bacterium]|jgi:beta-lactam-binding protein with PASTA domain|nr:hypothetical protein [Bryobacterales bacterium]